MAAKQDEDHGKSPPRHANNPDQPPGQADKPQPRSDPGQSQKSQISQYFKSQGRQPDDVVWSVGGLDLRLRDLD